MTMCSGGGVRASSRCMVGTKSSATVQQMQPFESSTMSSSAQVASPQPSSTLAIDADLAELVDDQRDPPAVVLAQEVADQAGLAGAEKAREHGGRNFSVRVRARHVGSSGYFRRCGRPAVMKTTASACSAIP